MITKTMRRILMMILSIILASRSSSCSSSHLRTTFVTGWKTTTSSSHPSQPLFSRTHQPIGQVQGRSSSSSSTSTSSSRKLTNNNNDTSNNDEQEEKENETNNHNPHQEEEEEERLLLTWEELMSTDDPELRKIEWNASIQRQNSLLLPQRISQAITTLAWLFVASGIILNNFFGLAYVRDPSGIGIGIGSLDQRDFQREIMMERRMMNAQRQKE